MALTKVQAGLIESTITSGTAVASTSGTSINFTGIPAGVKRITVMFNSVSTSGTSVVLVQLGTGATPTYTTTGYLGSGSSIGVGTALYTTGFGFGSTHTGAAILNGSFVLSLLSSATNTWAGNGATGNSNISGMYVSAGVISLAAVLTAVRITTVNGTDAFDAGSINIMWES